MNMYWVYNLPNWLFELLVVTLFIAFGLAGLFPTRAWMRRVHIKSSHNDIVGYYLEGITVLYGVSLGLLAIAAWQTFNDTQAKVAQEAAALYSLYRGVGSLPEPARTSLQEDLRQYARQVIDPGWAEQRRGIIPTANNLTLSKFQKDLASFTPTTEEQRILMADISRRFDTLDESRSIRLDSVEDELPPPLWALILVGALICVVVTWFFLMDSLSMHIWMTVFIAFLLGLMVFMVAALDNPYRGEVSVSPAPFERVYNEMINPPR